MGKRKNDSQRQLEKEFDAMLEAEITKRQRRKSIGRLPKEPTIEELQAAFDKRLARELEVKRQKENARNIRQAARRAKSKKRAKPKSRSIASKDFRNSAKFKKDKLSGRKIRQQKAKKRVIRARGGGVRVALEKGAKLEVHKEQLVFLTAPIVPLSSKVESTIRAKAKSFFRSFGAGLYWFKGELSVKAGSAKRFYTRWCSIARAQVTNYDEMSSYVEEFLLALNLIFVNYAFGNGKTKLKSVEFEFAKVLA